MFIWYWTQDVDPNFIVDISTPQQIEGWNDCLWTDPRVHEAQRAAERTTIDAAERIPIVQQMQQIFYERRGLRDPRLPVPARGVQHRQVAGLGARPRQGAR